MASDDPEHRRYMDSLQDFDTVRLSNLTAPGPVRASSRSQPRYQPLPGQDEELSTLHARKPSDPRNVSGLGITGGTGIHRIPTRESMHRRSKSTISDGYSSTPAQDSPYFDSDVNLLRDGGQTPSQAFGHPKSPVVRCPTNGKVLQRRTSWLSISILVLAIYSTIFSGIYMVVAFVAPRFGRRIGPGGGLAPSTASLLCALFAKTIELSFVTVFVAFLGQVLSRKAIAKTSQGITIADMTMRAWIMQPGTLITHWETVRYAALSILGLIALTATLVAMLYTTAADALVSPKLKLGPYESTILSAQVQTKFANPLYLADHCSTPITKEIDPMYFGTTCLQITHVGQAFHNYQQYISDWSLIRGNASIDNLAFRPNPTGTLYDNTTVRGSWINRQNITQESFDHGRMVNNITLAMPHAGVFAAAHDPINHIRQPADLQGLGEYSIIASVPSPAVNVLCVGMSSDELSPLIYVAWPGTNNTFNSTTWNFQQPADVPTVGDWHNKTVVDEIFGWGGKGGQSAPIFPKLPLPYNTMLNTTGLWPANAIYLLGASASAASDPPYVLCSLKAKQVGSCSTKLHAALSGAQLDSHCEDPTDSWAYVRSNPDVRDGNWESDWKNIASEWANSLSLGAGITDGAASNARLLTQFIPKYDNKTRKSTYDPDLPSISEALAVMAGSTLLLSTEDAPMESFWNYTDANLTTPIYQTFNATLQAQDYASGGVEAWQKIFHVILVTVFLTNVVCTLYLFGEIRGRQMTDFTEPQNLFALAMNSPASTRLQGACGAGPEGAQFNERWHVAMEEAEEHYYIRTKAEGLDESMEANVNADTGANTEPNTPASTAYERNSFVDRVEAEPMKSVSPAVDDFRRLSSRSLSLL